MVDSLTMSHKNRYSALWRPFHWNRPHFACLWKNAATTHRFGLCASYGNAIVTPGECYPCGVVPEMNACLGRLVDSFENSLQKVRGLNAQCLTRTMYRASPGLKQETAKNCCNRKKKVTSVTRPHTERRRDGGVKNMDAFLFYLEGQQYKKWNKYSVISWNPFEDNSCLRSV